jgi:CHAD domain-containing protein
MLQSTTTSADMVFSIDLETFLDKAERNIRRVDNRLDDYIKNPNEENIHNIRTAIRRLQATYISLPKKLRKKKKVREFVIKSKELFRINSKIRDYDIISEKLSKDVQSSPQQQNIELLQKLLKSQRKRMLNKAKGIALELRKISVPKLRDSDISQNKLEKRFNSIANKFADRIKKNFPIVVANSQKIRELHEMRKDCKKLRYLMELLPENESNSKNKISHMIKELEKVQNMLGIIHDYDTTIAYLRHQNRKRSIKTIIEKIANIRLDKYEQFVLYYKGERADTSDSSLFFTQGSTRE